MFLVVLPGVFLLVLSYEPTITPHTNELAPNFFQTTYLHVILHEVTLKGHPTEIGALQGDVLALWQVFVHHLLVGGFEVAMLADIGPLSTVLSHCAYFCPHTGSCPGQGPSECPAAPVSLTNHTPSPSCYSGLGDSIFFVDF